MTSIGDLFNHFMTLIGLRYYNKIESDNKYALKSDIPDSLTVDSSLSNSSTNPVQNKVVKGALDDKASSSHTHSQYLTSHQDISGKVNVSDIKDNLTSADTNKPLSAKQGKELKTLVDGKASSSHNHTKSQITDFPSIPSKTSDLTNDGDGTNVFVKNNDSRLSDNRTPTSHTHGNISNDGKIGSASGKIVTTGSNGVLTASNSITKSMISDFPTSMAPSSHSHNTGEVTDTSAYGNIGSSANATQKTINNNINTQLGNKANSSNVYSKSETYTQSEITTLISNAVSNLQLFEVVSSLPTSNIKSNRLYLIVNGESISNNSYDIYIRVNNAWEQLDKLEFDISNYYTQNEVDTLLNGKVDTSDSRLTNARTPTSHAHGDITNTGTIGTVANKPLITTTNGKIATGSFGTSANTFCQGNDSRLSDARTPTSHTHTKSQITDFPSIPSASSTTPSADTTNGSVGTGTTWAKADHTHPKSSLYAVSNHTHSQYLTSHQDISGKANINDLGAVAFSNSYDDLDDLPSFDGSYSSLTGIPAFGTTAGTICQGNDSRLSNSRTPTSHASSATTYGVGTTSSYGHCRTINNLTTSSHTNGYALSAYQGKLLKDSVDAKLGTATYSNGTLTIQ